MSSSNYKLSLKLISQCLSANQLSGVELQQFKIELSSSKVNWHKFFEFAGAHWLLPYVHYRLDQNDLVQFVPRSVLEELCSIRKLVSHRNQLIQDQLEELITSLNCDRITPLLLKGASYLLKPVDPVQQLRMTSDIDIVIPEHSLQVAISNLKTIGYEFMGILADGTEYHLDPLYKKDRPVRVELHKHPLAPSAWSLLAADEAWQNAEMIDKNDMKYLVLTPEFRLIHQFAHAEIHSEDHANSRLDLRQLYDSYLLLFDQTLDWDLINSKTSATKYQNIWMDYLQLIKTVFSKIDIPDLNFSYEQRFQTKKLLAHLTNSQLEEFSYYWLERSTRLPKRLKSKNWYKTKLSRLS